MRFSWKNALRILYIAVISVLLLTAVFASDEEYELRVYPDETTGGQIIAGDHVPMLMSLGEENTPSAMSENGIRFVVNFEGFSPEPLWDYQQYSIGYGNSYELAKELFGEDCAPITEEQAMELFRYGLIATENYMNDFYRKNNIVLNQNQYDALMSFTYNVGIGWTVYKNDDGTWCKLKTLLLSDPATWTSEAVHEALGTWIKAGGVVLPGLVTRRAAEADMFVTPVEGDAEISGGEDKVVFQDVAPTDWFYKEVMDAYELGLVRGNGSDKFMPLGEMTRAQMVVMLANLHGLDMDNSISSGFEDVQSGAWYTAAVVWAAENGYVYGDGNGHFYPDALITREQMCTILARYMLAQGYQTGTVVNDFKDDNAISDYARECVYFCAELGLINGSATGHVMPLDGATRCQATVVMLRTYQYINR